LNKKSNGGFAQSTCMAIRDRGYCYCPILFVPGSSIYEDHTKYAQY